MVAIAHTTIAARRPRDFHHARDACIQYKDWTSKRPRKHENSKVQAHRHQTLVQDRSRPTKEEPCQQECNRRWRPPGMARTRKPSSPLVESSWPSWTLPHMSSRFPWYQTYRSFSVQNISFNLLTQNVKFTTVDWWKGKGSTARLVTTAFLCFAWHHLHEFAISTVCSHHSKSPDCFPYSVLVAPVPSTAQLIGLCLVQLDADVPSIVAIHFEQLVHHHTFQANLRHRFETSQFLPHQAFKVRTGLWVRCCEIPLNRRHVVL